MSHAGDFNDRARAAIYEIGQGLCIGDGRSDLSAQHRRPRGMGGTSDVQIGHPANGVPLCGDGVRGCHGWAEHNRKAATLLGWLLEPGQPAIGAPFWSRIWGWRAWQVDETGFPFVVHVYPPEDFTEAEHAERRDAISQFIRDRVPPVNNGLKSQR